MTSMRAINLSGKPQYGRTAIWRHAHRDAGTATGRLIISPLQPDRRAWISLTTSLGAWFGLFGDKAKKLQFFHYVQQRPGDPT
jgi:hypothetical protein